MFDKLAEVEARYQELGRLLADPEVLGKRDLLLRYSKEHADIREICEVYQRYRTVKGQLEQDRELLRESDLEMRELARQSVAALEAELGALEQKLRLLLLPKDPNDERNVLLEVRGGTGGEEAALFAGDLFRMYLRYAERKRWRVDILSRSEASAGGIKEVIALIEGERVFSQLKYESGVHRVQRVPVTEAQGRIHTSAATVMVLPEAEDVDIRIDEKDLRIDVQRASGPGGQSVNTTDSAVRVTHLPTGLQVLCMDEKSQHKNRAKAMKILRSRLYDIEQAKQQEERASARRSSIKSGDRSEKIRTYNFPQDRLTDHRIGLTKHNLQAIIDGDLDEIIDACRTYFQAEALRG